MKWSALAAMCVIVLAGCTIVEPPDDPEADEVARARAEVLDRTWEATGLSGLVDRPVVQSGDALNEGEWSSALVDCMTEAGAATFGYLVLPGGALQLVDDNGGVLVDTEMQLAFYRCVAAHPADRPYVTVLSAAQLDYVYDYFISWTVPCLIDNGFEPGYMLTRDEFVDLHGDWHPFESVRVSDVSDFESMNETCGPERPDLG